MTPARSLESTLWPRVLIGDGCWEWTGVRTVAGYGWIRRIEHGRRVTHYVHRVVYELLVEPIPDGLTIDHLCRNRLCVRPDHLEAVTLAENKRRGQSPSAVNARKLVCYLGHPLDGRDRRGRYCKECHRRRQRLRYATHGLTAAQKQRATELARVYRARKKAEAT